MRLIDWLLVEVALLLIKGRDWHDFSLVWLEARWFSIKWPIRDRIFKREVHPRFPMLKNWWINFADWSTKEICGFAICGSSINHVKIADLQFSDWHNLEISGFCGRGMSPIITCSCFAMTDSHDRPPLPTRPKVRAKRAGQSGGEWPAGCDFVCDGWFMPPAPTNRTACPGLELLSCERLTIPASAVAGAGLY